MKTHEEAINTIVDLERKLGLYEFKIAGIPLWNVIRYKIRGKYLLHETGIDEKGTARPVIRLISLIKYFFLSFKQIIFFLIKNDRVDNLVMGFSRLEKVGEFYLDKFVDPIINQTHLKDSYVYFEYGKTGQHKNPRLNKDKIIYLDCPYLLCFILGIAFSPLLWMFNYKVLNAFYREIKVYVIKDDCSFKFILFSAGEAFWQYHFFKFVLKRIHAKRLFGVSRVLFLIPSLAAKRMNVPVYELQHGITNGATRLYSGYYNPEIDPDFFLTFGESCSPNVFGIPSDKILNIGWAFNTYVNSFDISNTCFKNTFLLVSDPEISQQIVSVTALLAEHYSQYVFHIRRHPQEQFNEQQKKVISQYSNILDVSSSINSNIAIRSYDFILGENSTVLYEALSIGKKVGRICFGGLYPKEYNFNQEDGFYYLHKIEELENIVYTEINHGGKVIYSDFNTDLFNSFLL